jgi:hypothetical protein
MMCVMRAISFPLILFETESLGRSQLLAHEVVQIKLNPKRSRTGVNVEACQPKILLWVGLGGKVSKVGT